MAATVLLVTGTTAWAGESLRLLPAAEQSGPTRVEEPDLRERFQAGTFDLQFYAGAVQDSFGRGGETVIHGTVAAEYFLVDGLAMVWELVGYGVDQEPPRAAGAGLNALGRWYLLRLAEDRLGLFVEGGAGVSQFSRRMPSPDGTHFNFSLHAGVGANYRITDRISLLAAARYLHFSNARMQGKDRNPSFDGFGGYAGLSIAF